MRTKFSHFVWLIALLGLALATDARAEEKSQDCQGGYLVGFNTMRGVWLDRIGAICRAWDAGSQSLGSALDHPLLAASGGGGPQRVECPDGFAVGQVEYVLPSIAGQRVAEKITLTCQRVKWPHDGDPIQLHVQTTGDGRSDDAYSIPMGSFGTSEEVPIESCDTGTIATGFTADVGQFVGALTLKCGPWPVQSAAGGGGAAPPPAPPPPAPSGPPASAQVAGSWYFSCSNASLYNNVLAASCKTTTGLDVASTLDLTTCNQPPGAANINGKLVCENAPAAGSWYASCSKGSVSSNVLTASCKTTTGLEVTSSLNLLTCNQPPAAANINGQLVCENGVAAPTPVPPSNKVEGVWKTNNGVMTLTQSGNTLSATYGDDGGHLKLQRQSNGSWTGHWAENASGQKCPQQKLGSFYWGRVELKFSDQNRHFEGSWAYCGAAPVAANAWTGDRVK